MIMLNIGDNVKVIKVTSECHNEFLSDYIGKVGVIKCTYKDNINGGKIIYGISFNTYRPIETIWHFYEEELEKGHYEWVAE